MRRLLPSLKVGEKDQASVAEKGYGVLMLQVDGCMMTYT